MLVRTRLLRSNALLAAFVSIAFVAIGVRTAAAPMLAVPAGTTVVLRPTGTGSMANLHNAGDPIDFTVMNDVIVDGWVVIPKGSPAHGTIAELTRPGAHLSLFKSGISQASLKFSFQWVAVPAGKIRLDSAPVEVKGRQLDYGSKKTPFGTGKPAYIGVDPFLTAQEYGVDAKTSDVVHIAETQRATAVEQAEQNNSYVK